MGFAALCVDAGAGPPHPPLPTPCLAGNCGSAAQSFLQSGMVSAVATGTTMDVTQSTGKVILNWASFNIASGYKVDFIQPSATAAALNQIWSADPSVISGQLTANGQIYLINQNGIVFDKGAQVDVGGLVASTLPLRDPVLFENGILSENGNTGSAPPPVFQAPATGTAGAVDVDAGATLTTSDGGRIMLLGSAVTNAGSISTPDGQTILGGASNAVYLAASNNPAMRGLLIAVDGGGTTGTVTNTGQISAPRGNITLAGLMVNQRGLLSATTSVTANGSIYLVAGDTSGSGDFFDELPLDRNGNPTAFGGLLPNNGGTLVLAPGSETEVLPDATDTTTVTAQQQAQFIPSEIELTGLNVTLEGNATVRAPSGIVNVRAAADPAALITSPNTVTSDNTGSIYLDKGSTIDVSGLQQVAVPATQNVLQVTLETNDLQDDPLLRSGFLHGTTVTVDANLGSTIFNVAPYAANIGKGIEQISTNAGSIVLQATGQVVTRAGSTLNVSGGSVAYQGAFGPSTTKLIGENGVVYDISKAPVNIPYVGLANVYSYIDPTWGTRTSVTAESYYPGYIQGANAGTIIVEAPQTYLRGTLLAETVAGLLQRSPGTLAQGGTFVLGCGICGNTSNQPDFGISGGVTFVDNLEDELGGDLILADGTIAPVILPGTSLLSPTQLEQSGFNSLGVYSNGPVSLPGGTTLALAPDGSFSVKSTQSIDIAGAVQAPAASVVLQTVNAGAFAPHNITLGPGAVIDVSGNWINDSPLVTPQPGTAPTVINGGSVAANASGNVMLGAGSVINVSGGGWLNQSNQLSAGSAGKISLTASFTLDANDPVTDPYTGLIDIGSGARLLGASLHAGGGGTLALQSGSVTVGSTAAGTAGELLLAPQFFTQGGFASYQIAGENDVIIGNLQDLADREPVSITPLQQNLVLSGNWRFEPTGADLASFSALQTLPEPQRQPASVSFTTNTSDIKGGEIGDVTLERDASILTDPGAAVTLAANGYNGDVRVFGSIVAPAGSISLQLTNGSPQSGSDPGFLPDQDIEIGPAALLAARGYAKIDTLDPLGLPEGSVLAGGTISLVANKGFVVTDPGSRIDVSGVAGVLDLVGANSVTATTVAANAGSINIAGREGIVLQGALVGGAATLDGAPVAGAGGGSLTLGLGNPPYTNAGPNGTAQEGGGYPTTLRVITLESSPVAPPSSPLPSGTASIYVGTLESGGFDNLTIRSADVINFDGTVALHAPASLTLDAPLFTAGSGTRTSLSAAYVAVGNYFNNPDYFDTGGFASPNAPAVLNPVSGSGSLSVNAQLIDIRGISAFSGFATETFSSSGDIRFVGSQNTINAPPAVNVPNDPSFEGALNTVAGLTLRGAQLYPTTAAGFAVNDLPSATSPTATTVAILTPHSATPAVPLSAGGSLSVNATDITQAGVLRAPFGQIALNGVPILDSQGNVQVAGSVTLEAGSITSVSSDGRVIPYGATSNGVQWTYSPGANVTNVLSQPPAKQVSLNGTDVDVQSGATVNLAGGGDLYAYEFVAGQGGSVDVLDPNNLPAANHPPGKTIYTYAVIPGLGSAFAPFDPQYWQNSPATTGQTITLPAVGGLPAGTYALLPARYALLPGAFAVQVVQQDSNIIPGTPVLQPDGTYLVAARFGVAGTNVMDSQTSSVLVASDSVVRTQSQYTDSYANTFFTNAALTSNTAPPQVPADAGQLELAATRSLALNGAVDLSAGTFASASAGKSTSQAGQGGDVAIQGQNLIVESASTAAPAANGTVELSVQQLNALDAGTLILGASSSETAGGEQLTSATLSVELKNTTPLTAGQVIIAAQDSVTLDASAQVLARSTSGTTASPSTLLLPGGGALLRVSSGVAAALVVDPTTLPANPTGVVSVGAGADVEGTGSVLLYGTNGTTLASNAQIQAPAVSLYSSLISVGAAPANTPGLTLTPEILGTLKGLSALTLGSSSTIDFYGAVQIGTPGSVTPSLTSITLDASGLGGYGAGDKVLQAGAITLDNSSGAAASFATPPDGSGALELIASAAKGSGEITLGPGSKSITGFSALNLQADGDIYGSGTGSLTVMSSAAVPLTLESAALVGANGSQQSISTTGSVTVTRSTANPNVSLTPAGVGAQLVIQGSDIAQDGSIDFPAGSISLQALNGNVALGGGSLTSAAGIDKGYTVTDVVAAGGPVSLIATSGNVAIASGATVDVSGASSVDGNLGGDAGSLTVSAPQGTFTYTGSTLKGGAPAGGQQGSFTLDVGSGLSGSGFAALESALTASGFQGAIDIRTRSDPAVTISGNVRAASFELSADQGSIDVAGTAVINTSGGTTLDTDGGSIALWAGQNLTLEAGAQLLANAGSPGPVGPNGTSLAARGGDVTLGVSSGQIQIFGGTAQSPTTISMQGTPGAGADGTLTLRAPRTPDDTNVQVTVQNAASVDVVSGNPVIVEGYRAYAATQLGSTDSGCGSGGSCDVADLNGLLFTDAASFMTHAAAITAALGLPNVQVRPGIEVDSPASGGSNGDLTLGSTWDLASWNAGLATPAPFNVTLRAAGNLIFNASLTDGFTNNGQAVPMWTFGEPTAGAASGSYTLTAGADLTAADPLAVVKQPAPASSLGAPPNSGNLILTPGNLIRTGTGNIEIAAGGDVLLGYAFNGYDANGNLQVSESDPQTSALYTAGVPAPALDPSLFAPVKPGDLGGQAAAYPTGGGDISVTAADDIRSALSAQLVTDWLWRRGSPTSTTGNPHRNTTWWVMFNLFQQGIGALGGGGLSLSAGRDIVNTSAVIPTTGRLAVAEGDTPVLADLLLTGGGSLRVQAGGDIISGVYEDDWGNAAISAGGALRSSTDSTFGQAFPGMVSPALPPPSFQLYPTLVVGNGVFDVSARGGITLAAVTNSTTLPLTLANQQAVVNGDVAFFAYAPVDNPGTLNLVSAGGNVVLNNDPITSLPIAALSNLAVVYEAASPPANYLSIYPPTLNVASLSGDIDLGNAASSQGATSGVSIALFPAATGNLTMLAAGSINNNSQPMGISMSEADPTQVPTALTPQGVISFTGISAVPLPLVPLHQSDPQPIALVAATGSIEPGTLTFPKAADVIAGGDITDVSYDGKNLNPSDVTQIAAGGDIVFSTPTTPVTNALIPNGSGIQLAGPGYLEVLAGGTIDLGDGNGLLTTGSLSDVRLPSTGASILVGAGFGSTAGGLRQPAYQSFIDAYLAPGSSGAPSAYAATLQSYMEQLYPVADANIGYAAALAAFEALTRPQQLPLLAQVLSDELSATGLAHTLQGASYDRGYTAIDTLFPTEDAGGNAITYSGDLDMFFSQLKTEQGGDIDLLVPGGSVNVGVPNPPASLYLVKASSAEGGLVTIPPAVNLGVLVLGEGAVEGFADQNFTVNQSRILTLEGGDIILWASNGNIDAGKGAKSASGAPPPVIQTDANGNLFVNPSSSVSGSGIGQLLTSPNIKPGLVNLIAPKGAVNAGDAGIRVAGNLNIAAVQVIGASNITVAGTATGVPVSEAGALSGALSGANALGGASNTAVDQLSQNLAAANNYQQLTESLVPTFIVVKMFCLGAECEQH
ncbi:MAG TPA: filamentous hemagglutinin family protein [Steroidobacteraceae bacterium]|nr:filamentous hemagglutinin family protein [Steroidobacteraceae bacterium]